MIRKNEAIERLNELGKSETPFSFYCDFLGERWCIEKKPLSFRMEINAESQQPVIPPEIELKKHPVSFQEYHSSFSHVVKEIKRGNSFLTNLTFQTPIESPLTMEEIFHRSHAKYKLLVPEKFVVFSPEEFVKIRGHTIYSSPMKGTIDADLAHAKTKILNDGKEKAEHITIVDLIRNDLSRIARHVEVTRFRYIDEIHTNQKRLLQVSSEITATLEPNWRENLGTILSTLLPAGSVSGAPKKETMRIIQEVETYQRGFYTGICGHFDGETLYSGVMIRFIKKEGPQLYYCSGGGITSSSRAKKEYQEMMDKIYLPY